MPLTPRDVEERVRAVFEIWNSLDPVRIGEVYSGAPGFGYRTRDPRTAYPSTEAYLEAFQAWLAALEEYRIELDEIHTAVEGDVGIAWGFYHEELQTRGGPREVLHGRFSEVVRREPTGWRTVFYHRDATPFDARGRYAPRAP